MERLHAFPRRLRAFAVLLQAVAMLNALELGARIGLDMLAPADPERAPLPLMVQRLFFFTVLPLLAFQVLRILCSARLVRRDAVLELTTLHELLEVPRASIALLEPLWPPLPAPGAVLRLRSGRKLDLALVSGRIFALLETPMPDAEARWRTRWLRNAWLQLGLVPALVTFVLFRLHQIITFGGLLGELRSLGLASWLHTLLGVALYVFAHLFVLAACLRAAVGLVCWPAARFLPRAAGRVRLFAEAAAALAYDGGIAAVLVLRLLL